MVVVAGTIPNMERPAVPDQVVQDLCVRTPANHREITFIHPDELTDAERVAVPQLWLDALNVGGRDGMRLIIDEWDRVLPGRLPKVTARFRAAGTDLFLGRQLGRPVLIYLLTGHFGDREYCPWVGAPPVPIADIPQYLRRLPNDVLAFHTALHDELDSPLMGGILPIQYMDLVSTYDDPSWPFEMFDSCWSDPPIPAPTEQPDWSQVVLVANNGASGRVCAVLGDDPESTEGWYWFEGSMSRERDIWEILDVWFEHGANDWYYDDKDG